MRRHRCYFNESPPMQTKPYRDLNTFLQEKYGMRVWKVCVDGGFTCPNRDGMRGVGGCIFCGERGAGEHLAEKDGIKKQVADGMDLLREKCGAERFIVYFQNFSNTYAPVEILRRRYAEALSADMAGQVVVLAVGTRPDCVDEAVAGLLAEFGQRRDVWVELGLQSASDATAERIGRGYTTAEFTRAVETLRRRRLDVIVHLMLGLPDETCDDVQNTVEFLRRHDIQGVKIHSLYVMHGTPLAEMYRRGEFCPISQKEYVRQAVYVLRNLRPEVVVHRLTGDCPAGMLAAPEWNGNKAEILREIEWEMQREPHV